ncbi:hypothetical protein [Devosia sp.]|uniref:hypothetical protein n=1 Tax=Devosia sp. TaxID=1871048 RepID=UPI0019F0AEBA|nr:hypothetical protein [Devosia sp.]MBE0577844.1 hypothetical protein [Devosia sp.]
MAYKAPLPLRLFQYALWAIMLFVLVWFFVIPLFLRATAPQAPPAQQSPSSGADLDQPLGMTEQDGRDPTQDDFAGRSLATQEGEPSKPQPRQLRNPIGRA